MSEYIEREKLGIGRCNPEVFEDKGYAKGWNAAIDIIQSAPAADALPALWTDEPISGTEFMTHNQGQSGFEIHFRTDDRAKYEAVQDECRRQIGHAKPATDVREVKRGKWIDMGDFISCSSCNATRLKEFESYYGKAKRLDVRTNFCPNCGADMREVNDGKTGDND